jgi:hypothetical protein
LGYNNKIEEEIEDEKLTLQLPKCMNKVLFSSLQVIQIMKVAQAGIGAKIPNLCATKSH